MHKHRVFSIAGQASRAAFGLAVWLYGVRCFMTVNDITVWFFRAGFALLFLGGLANVVVVMLNRGFMPVRLDVIDGEKALRYQPVHGATRLACLGDCIRLGAYYASPGDLLLYVGVALTMGGGVFHFAL